MLIGKNINFFNSIFFESFKQKKSLSRRKPNFGGFTSQFLGQTILGFLLVRFEKIVITIKEFLRSSPQQANSVLISLKNSHFFEEIQTFHNKELKVFGEVRNFLTNYKVIKKIKGFLFFWSDVIANNLFTKIQSDILGINSIALLMTLAKKQRLVLR